MKLIMIGFRDLTVPAHNPTPVVACILVVPGFSLQDTVEAHRKWRAVFNVNV